MPILPTRVHRARPTLLRSQVPERVSTKRFVVLIIYRKLEIVSPRRTSKDIPLTQGTCKLKDNKKKRGYPMLPMWKRKTRSEEKHTILCFRFSLYKLNILEPINGISSEI